MAHDSSSRRSRFDIAAMLVELQMSYRNVEDKDNINLYAAQSYEQQSATI
jgi:hypothetical protein